MGRKNKPLPVIEKLEIIDVAAEGKAIGKFNELVVFVPGVIPGDIVDVQINRKKSSFMEGYPIRFHKHSDKKTSPECAHFGECGGCKWQNLPYPDQLFYKQKQVTDSFQRIGKVELPETAPIIGSENIYYYRNKLEFTFSNRRWMTREEVANKTEIENFNALGFHVPKMFDRVVDINKCLLQGDPSNEIRNHIRTFALENNLSFYDLRANSGLLRTMIIRTTDIGELMVIVIFGANDKPGIEKVLESLKKTFPQITSLQYVINLKLNDTITDQNVIVYSGNEFIFEEMAGLKFKIGPKSFYQTNSKQAFTLYKKAKEFAGLHKEDTVYDLYTGTGTIANFVASDCKKVIGIEYVPEAIEDAKENSKINGLTNTLFFAGDMKDVLNEGFINKHGRPDVIITDPPRAGMHQDVINTILNILPAKIVYVSCNPATQARDVNLLSEKYQVTAIQPVDMFPHTHHVENVALLKLK
ncbi:MAG: 23S rRNA (uracil-5-)-methyltransferase RumA [Bacteroidetes bacterium GWF2_38_335]|nr:MAG: 23S rRNA (uracil-5-)-methyltransferase RumA [Bacteroidetes bacterium GWF2_38_335]OFY79168.1 MAG: 23S rRNA (uracil-5-)-methyltransferase RumA [Bacteroidetes bacterium RIFOXYA12_FULL_38_20]HBS86099.1 23S rRNA (uracil(1939)-C(5))-methyltransferase RlmD [Bacteroidales bacterium]